ncbi:MAG: SMC-Scp complex subunit ScpB [Candidatus Omnitrophica bacterium]|nr:SMC-Scp complex subunit ScpB [Candidatus Omnitrophota bacterium]
MMDRDERKLIIEALLFVSDKPVSIDALKSVIKDIDPTEIRAIIEELNAEYAASARSFSIKEIAGGFQMLTDPVYSKWIAALYKRPPDRLTGPSLETLAIIAYKQPLTRSDIEAIRGVNVDGVLGTLEERGLIRTRGRLEAPGRPILYGTTTEFLQHFGLKSIEELPKLKEFKESDLDFIKEKEKTQTINTQTGKLVTESHETVKEGADNNEGPAQGG